MRRALKLLGVLLLGLGLLVVLLVSAALLVLERPGLVLNTKTATWALRRFGAPYQPSWTALSLEARSLDLRTKRLVLEADDVCFSASTAAVKGCFPRVALDATVRLDTSPFVSVERLDTLVVRESSLTIDETALPPAAPAAGKRRLTRLAQLVPRPLRGMRLGLVDLDLPSVEVKTSSGVTTAGAALRYSARQQAPMTGTAFVVERDTSGLISDGYTARLLIDSDLLRVGRLTYLKAAVRARSRRGLVADLDAKTENAGRRSLRFLIHARVKTDGRAFSADLNAVQTPRRYVVRGSATVLDPAGPARRVELSACRMEAPVSPGTTSPRAVDLRCGLAVEPAPVPLLQGTTVIALAGSIQAHAELKPKLFERDYFEASVKADIGPEPRFEGLYARLALDAAGRLTRLPESLRVRHQLVAGLTVGSFQDLVSYLKGTAYAVPAPFNVLRGPIAVEARTAGDGRAAGQRVDYSLVSALHDGRQALNARVTGSLFAQDLFVSTRSFSDTTDVELQKVALELPYLKLGPVPAFLPDSRIATSTAPARAPSAAPTRRTPEVSTSALLSYEAHVFTSAPILLYSNLVNEPVPVALDVRLRRQGLAGTITIQSFHMQAFRQNVLIDHLKLTAVPGATAWGLDGLIVYKKEGLVIDIRLLGNTDKPQVTFTSTPPLTQDEIIGVLLFGKSPGQLDIDQQTSVGNASTALNTGGFGLASLYLFASTPIEYVGYDPSTQTYQIKLKLPGGATLSVGSTIEESRTLTLRKRLSSHFAIETQLQQNQPGVPQNAVTTFLEYFKRY